MSGQGRRDIVGQSSAAAGDLPVRRFCEQAVLET
jgi:hypothetical protein